MSLIRLTTIESVKKQVALWRQEKQRIGLVPTMGALHEGHLALVRHARQACDKVITYIFVNPTQFAPHEDLSRYPRQPERDAGLLNNEKCDALFMPDAAAIYPPDFKTAVTVADITTNWEGVFRPTHFAGVTTILAKFFNIIRPDAAFFGEKDYQQLCAVRQMAHDLNFDIDIAGVPIVREADGLALSSRNVYLTEKERAIAPLIYQTLCDIAQNIRAGKDVPPLLQKGADTLLKAGFTAVDYLALTDAETLAPLDQKSGRPMRLLTVARMGATRLLDNIAV